MVYGFGVAGEEEEADAGSPGGGRHRPACTRRHAQDASQQRVQRVLLLLVLLLQLLLVTHVTMHEASGSGTSVDTMLDFSNSDTIPGKNIDAQYQFRYQGGQMYITLRDCILFYFFIK